MFCYTNYPVTKKFIFNGKTCQFNNFSKISINTSENQKVNKLFPFAGHNETRTSFLSPPLHQFATSQRPLIHTQLSLPSMLNYFSPSSLARTKNTFPSNLFFFLYLNFFFFFLFMLILCHIFHCLPLCFSVDIIFYFCRSTTSNNNGETFEQRVEKFGGRARQRRSIFCRGPQQRS